MVLAEVERTVQHCPVTWAVPGRRRVKVWRLDDNAISEKLARRR